MYKAITKNILFVISPELRTSKV